MAKFISGVSPALFNEYNPIIDGQSRWDYGSFHERIGTETEMLTEKRDWLGRAIVLRDKKIIAQLSNNYHYHLYEKTDVICFDKGLHKRYMSWISQYEKETGRTAKVTLNYPMPDFWKTHDTSLRCEHCNATYAEGDQSCSRCGALL